MVVGPAEEENAEDEYECISGLLTELADQMGRCVGKGLLAIAKRSKDMTTFARCCEGQGLC
jgi:hypothetical protein